MPVQFQFVTETGLSHVGSILIRWFTWAPVSHVDLVLPNGKLLGARSKAITAGGLTYAAGVQARPPEYLKFSKVIRATLFCSATQEDAIYAMAQKQLGKPYDLANIADFVFHDDKDDLTGRKWICSALIQWLTEVAGVPLLNPDVPVQRIAPGHLLMSPVLHYDPRSLR